MAERSYRGKVSTPRLGDPQKSRGSSSSKAEMSKKVEGKPRVKAASGTTKQNTDDHLVKEEQYKLLNAELEAKTADLVKQAEELMRERSEVLTKPLSNLMLANFEDEDDVSTKKPHRDMALESGVKAKTKKRPTSTSKTMCSGKQGKESNLQILTTKASPEADVAAVEDSEDLFLAKTIQSMEEKMSDEIMPLENVLEDPGDNIASGVSDAQIRVLKAKLRIMQEELEQLSCEYYKKDDENAKLSAKMKELEEDKARLQRTTSIQQSQIEKHRALAEESAKKSDGLQVQVSALKKEIENLNRSQKQAAAVHSTAEVRLNRALEEVERLKTQLNKMKLADKDKTSDELQSKENLLAENKMLKKQKAELIVGFKKQLKLIDVLKRQKMHFEAAKLLSFTEDEFMKALDWGKS